ncbi:MAG: hypothetical protein H6993_08885 [Pseudomonadales bacterium]|nr:hypothetical protein [Pseudomonadales bacterium]
MIVLLNGALGIGKSTLAEALSEEWSSSVMLDGDYLVALNPEPMDTLEYLHKTICLLMSFHLENGYRNFIINHIWSSQRKLEDLVARIKRVDPTQEVRCFLLMLTTEENLKRVSKRQESRVIDEIDYELEILARERAVLYGADGIQLGEPFDVSASPDDLVSEMKLRLDIE